MKTTNLENQMIIDIARSEMTESNGAVPIISDEATTFLNFIVKSKSSGGVSSSLVKKGLVWIILSKPKDMWDTDDSMIGLTEEGFKVYKSLGDK